MQLAASLVAQLQRAFTGRACIFCSCFRVALWLWLRAWPSHHLDFATLPNFTSGFEQSLTDTRQPFPSPCSKMADPLSIAGSIAGLITIADVVIRNGYKYIAAVKGADKAVLSLVQETNSLVGVLHSLRNVAEGLEGGNVPFLATTQVHHIESCFRTLKKIQTLLDKFEISKSKDLIHRSVQHFKWPLAESQTKSLASEVSGHRETLALALNADEM